MENQNMQSEKKRCPKYQYNYKKLRGRIKEYYDTQDSFAQALGIGRVSLSQRLSGKLEFSQSEIYSACNLLNISGSDVWFYFFDTSVNTYKKVRNDGSESRG